jgi:transmembrane sensor
MNKDTEKVLLAEQAAEWLIRIESATTHEREEFWSWVKQSPLHVREVLAAQACQIELRELFREKRIDAQAFVRSAHNVHAIGTREAVANDATSLDTSDYRVAHSNGGSGDLNRPRRLMAAAMMAVALLAAALFTVLQLSGPRIATVAGEWQSEVMEDGSIVQVGPRTKLSVEFANDHRVVKLSEGEALFRVAHDTARPFLVETPLAAVRAVGTSFAVSLDSAAQVRVTVQEGVVAVARGSQARELRKTPNLPGGRSITLKAGEQVAVTRSGDLAAAPVNVEAALAWTKRQLIFERETVEEAAHEFNRRNELQIKVLDPQLQTRAVRGVFEAADPQAFAAYLERQGTVAVLDKGSRTLLIAPYPGVASRKADN